MSKIQGLFDVLTRYNKTPYVLSVIVEGIDYFEAICSSKNFSSFGFRCPFLQVCYTLKRKDPIVVVA